MPRGAFDRELDRVQEDLLALGSMVQAAIARSVDGLKRRDLQGARVLIGEDNAINRKRFDIESDCLTLIATQQPMARDLRTLAAILEIAGELERIADYAKGIAKISLLMGAEPPVKPLVDIPLMAQKAQDMLRRALQAFIDQDVELARAIPAEDDEVDALYNQVYRELIGRILADPRITEQANYLLWVAHNLERTADRVSNICERVVFTVTGELVEMDVESGIHSVAG